MDQPTSGHWCHECNAETAAAPVLGSNHGELICPTCRGCFIESLESARSLIHVRRSVERHERVQQRLLMEAAWAEAESNSLAVEVELSIPAFREEVMRLVSSTDLHSSILRPSGLHSITSNAETQAQLGDVTHESDARIYGDAHEAHDLDTTLSYPAHADVNYGMSSDAPSELDERIENCIFGDVDAARDGGLNYSELSRYVHVSRLGSQETSGNVEWRDELGTEFPIDGNSDGEDSNSDEEISMLEHSDWDSFGEDGAGEWEGVENQDLNSGAIVEQGLEEGISHLEVNRQIALFSRRLRLYARNRYDPNVEMDLDSLDLNTYVGNPGDYVDERGFDELLQHFIDSDTTRRGAPPAAKAIVEGLPTVFVQQKDVDDGSALCAICKDVVAFSEPAKQLPCLHVYHRECILPWLGARNSCPVCRYELATDDPDYEEQRGFESMMQARGQEPRSGGNGSALSDDVSREAIHTEGHANEEAVEMEGVEMFADPSKGDMGNEGEASNSSMVDSEQNEHVRTRISLREVMSSPLFRVAGVVVVSCIGNFLMGSSFNRSTVESQAVGVRNCTRSRSWWASLFG